MADFTQKAWSNKVMRAPPDERRELIQQLNAGKHRVTDDAGQSLDLSPPPATCTTAPRVELTRDQFGRTKRVTPVEPFQAETPSNSGAPRLSPEDLASYQAFANSFKGLPPEQHQRSMEKLFETFVPHLIHDHE